MFRATLRYHVPCAQVNYREYDFGHLDFTFAVKEELKLYLLQLLRKGCG